MRSGLYRPTFTYGGIGTPDITGAANLILGGLSTPSKMADKHIAQERQAAQDAQNKQLFDIKMQEVDRANKERVGKELLASGLMKLPTQSPSTEIVTPAITQEDVELARKALLDKEIDVSTKYVNAFERLSKETMDKPVPGQFKKVGNYDVTNVPGTQNKKYIDPQTGKSLTFDPESIIGKMVYGDKYYINEVPIDGVNKVPKYTTEQAHEMALKESEYSENIGIDESKLPKVSKAVTKTTMKDLSDTEIKQGKLDLVKRLANEGSIPATLALEVVNKINAPKTSKEKLDELKYLLDVKEQSRKDKELEAKIKSGYFGKSSGEGFSFGEKLYTLAGPDGLDAARKYMSNNKDRLDNMGTGDKKELLAYLTAKYGHEDDWFNWTGWDDLK